MKIENFDTGLIGQEDVENIIITPEENFNKIGRASCRERV